MLLNVNRYKIILLLTTLLLFVLIAIFNSNNTNRENYEQFLLSEYSTIPDYTEEQLDAIPKPEHPHIGKFQDRFMTIDPNLGYIPIEKLHQAFIETKRLKNHNTRKSMIELRPDISGFYKGLIYCFNLTEALEISKKLNVHIQNNIRTDLISEVKRGCSEYPLEFPQYKEIKISGDQPMNYNDNWRSIEKEMDRGNKDWGKANKSIEGFNLNNFLIMRNWIAYAQKIGDQSVNKITNEQIREPKSFNYLNRDLHSQQIPKTKI